MKDIIFGQEAQERIARGVETIARAVGSTMGPGGQVVAIETQQAPTLTKDGVSVANQVDLVDPYEKLGADLVKQAARKTNDDAGDGTTTATVLAHALYVHGRKKVLAGQNPVSVKEEIERDVKQVILNLSSSAIPVDSPEKLEQVATISSNDPELGKIISGLITEVGKDGLITLEESPTFGIETELTQGMKLEGGYLRPEMVTDTSKMVAEMENCPILVIDRPLTATAELLPVLDDIINKGTKQVLLITDNLEGEALAFVTINQRLFKCVVVRCPGLGAARRREQMKDICALTGAVYVAEETGKELKDLKSDVLGKARKVIVSNSHFAIVGGEGKQEDVDVRIGSLKAEIEATQSDYDEQKLKERLANLTGKVGVIKIGGMNEVEVKEKKQRVEDAVNATRAAQEEGIVAGGGVALVRASQDTSIEEPLSTPLKTIAENAGKNGDIILEKTLDLRGNMGYNGRTGTFVDLVQAGVIDPLKVTRSALENASSVACLLLTTKAAIVNHREEKK